MLVSGYSGFCRPVINGGGATGCSGSPCYDETSTSNHFLVFNVSNVDLGFIEMTGLYWGGDAAANWGAAFYITAQSLTNSNVHDNYFHGWAHAPYPTSKEGEGCCAVILGSTGLGQNSGVSMYNNVIDGSDTDRQSFGASYGGPPEWDHNYINYAWSDTFNGEYKNINNNTILNTGDSYASAGGIHDNTFESNTDQAGGLLFYNNYLAHVSGTNGSSWGVMMWSAPQSGDTSYIFNNVIADSNSAGDNNLMCEKALSRPGGRCVYLNNTVECGPDSSPSVTCGSYDTGSPNGVVGVTVINNQFITSDGSCPTLSIHNGGSPQSTYTTNLCQSRSTASGQGYAMAQTFPFMPISATASTVAAGTLGTVECTAITVANSAAGTACLSDTTVGVGYDQTNHQVIIPNRQTTLRSDGGWNIGAYQWASGTSSTPPVAPTSLIATVQ